MGLVATREKVGGKTGLDVLGKMEVKDGEYPVKDGGEPQRKGELSMLRQKILEYIHAGGESRVAYDPSALAQFGAILLAAYQS
jgi:hypothetical protein